MGKAQRFGLGLLYGAIAILGATYGAFEQNQAIDRLASSMKQIWLPLNEGDIAFFPPAYPRLSGLRLIPSGRLSS
jgi:hypothetical protein